MFHPLMTEKEDRREWKAASNLQKGDNLITENGEIVYVEEVRVEKLAERVTVYNLEVEDLHVYYVAGVMVHNICGGTSEDTEVLYHYTTKEGAESIKQCGVIKSDSRGRVFVTTYQISPDEVNNALFMGRKPESGSHVVEIYLNDSCDSNLTTVGATQPNELIYIGSIRNGRNAKLVVKENRF